MWLSCCILITEKLLLFILSVNLSLSHPSCLQTSWLPCNINIVGSGVRPPPFLFYPHPFYKCTLYTKNSDPHPFSNLYISFAQPLWYYGNAVGTHYQRVNIYHLLFLFCPLCFVIELHNQESEEPPPFLVSFHPLYQSTLFSRKMLTPTLLQFFKISDPIHYNAWTAHYALT